ncbi:hypothetical protein M153_1100029189 [Pseudoloma neurophilia]|uniref:Uncharacterized protein n=1 Tax=Pseudoloma neurophilia TaxID=146866 RepID=A0A0R0M6Q1_9MICR|nr:hypothetical protein M153_1100029189 [Pseudoloma neurophilia]
MVDEHPKDSNSVVMSITKLIKKTRKQLKNEIEEESKNNGPFSSDLIDIYYAMVLLQESELFKTEEADEKHFVIDNDFITTFITKCVQNRDIQRNMMRLSEIIKEIKQYNIDNSESSDENTYNLSRNKRKNPKTKYRRIAHDIEQMRKQKKVPKLDTSKTKSSKFY